MKKLLLISSLLVSVSAFGDFKNAQDAISKLKTFSNKSFQGKSEKAIISMEDDLVDALDDAAKLAEKAPKSNELNQELVRVAVVLLNQDKTNYGAELILPVYKKYEQEFIALIKKLPKPDAQLLEESIQGAKMKLRSRRRRCPESLNLVKIPLLLLK